MASTILVNGEGAKNKNKHEISSHDSHSLMGTQGAKRGNFSAEVMF